MRSAGRELPWMRTYRRVMTPLERGFKRFWDVAKQKIHLVCGHTRVAPDPSSQDTNRVSAPTPENMKREVPTAPPSPPEATVPTPAPQTMVTPLEAPQPAAADEILSAESMILDNDVPLHGHKKCKVRSRAGPECLAPFPLATPLTPSAPTTHPACSRHPACLNAAPIMPPQYNPPTSSA